MNQQKAKRLAADPYLLEVEPAARALIEFLTCTDAYEFGCETVQGCGFTKVSILAVNSRYKSYKISNTGTAVAENGMLCTRGFVIRAVDGKLTAEYSCSELNEEDFPKIASALQTLFAEMRSHAGNRILEARPPKRKQKENEKEKTEYFTGYESHPDEMGDAAIVEFLENVRMKALACDQRVLDCNATCQHRMEAKLYLEGCRGAVQERKIQTALWMTGGVRILVKRDEEIKEFYKGYSNLGGAEVLSEMERDIAAAVSGALELLDSTPVPPGEYDCICAPDVTGLIVHEAFGHGVEMDMFVKKRALAEQYIGKRVASPLVTMHDGACAADQTASYLFDDEGTAAHDTVIIEKGILKRGISDLRSAGALGTQPTGNGRRESYKRKAYTRMTNTFFEPGKDTVPDMIASISYGFLLENASSGMEDPKNWGIQCMVDVAREIRDGKLTGKILSPVILTGYVPDLLQSISMISDGMQLYGGGMCGKGYKEWVKVSDGGPYIKARIRLG